MTSSKKGMEALVRVASDRLTGKKFCFSCSKERVIEGGQRRNGHWKCADCFKRVSDTWYGRTKKGGAK